MYVVERHPNVSTLCLNGVPPGAEGVCHRNRVPEWVVDQAGRARAYRAEESLPSVPKLLVLLKWHKGVMC